MPTKTTTRTEKTALEDPALALDSDERSEELAQRQRGAPAGGGGRSGCRSCGGPPPRPSSSRYA